MLSPKKPVETDFRGEKFNSGDLVSGPDWIRTSDLLIANEMLYQLSYGPIYTYPGGTL